MNQRSHQFRLEGGIIFSYFLLSLLILFPLVPHLFSQLPFASNGDIRLSLTVLFSNLKKISQGDLLNLFQLPILFPLSHTLTAGVNLFGQTLLVLPLYLAHVRNVYFLYNFLVFFAYAAAGYCAYRFAREWVQERWIAWIVGALYILMPYRVHNIPQLNLLFSFPIPLALLFFSRYLKKYSLKDLVFFFLSFLSQFLFDLSVAIFLGIALAIFFLLRLFLFGFPPKRFWLQLGAAFLCLALVVFFIFLPYLSQKTSFSIISEITAIPTFAFHSPLSFYSNWSYILLSFKGIVWHQSPFSPGIGLFIFFMLAFTPYLESRPQKILAWLGLSFLVIPALSMPFVFRSLQFSTLTRICGWALMLFFISLALLLFLIRKKAPQALLWLSGTWIVLQFFSSQVSLPFFNLFQFMAGGISFLRRARFIRTEYILLLLFFSVAAFGFSYFFKRFQKKKILLLLVLLLVFAERIRWPVYPEKLKDDGPNTRELYQLLAPYPKHFGLLELPFDPLEPNFYSFFTVYHDKHTYHGNINYLKDSFQLDRHPQLRPENKYSGLSDPLFIHMLKTKGVRLLLLFKNRELNESQRAYHVMQNQVRLGESRGLYERVAKRKNGTLLVLSEHEHGSRIRYFLPHFALRGKDGLICRVKANGEKEAEFLFNGSLVKKQPLQKEGETPIVIGLRGLPLALQFNYLEINSGPGLELINVRIE